MMIENSRKCSKKKLFTFFSEFSIKVFGIFCLKLKRIENNTKKSCFLLFKFLEKKIKSPPKSEQTAINPISRLLL